MQLNMRVHSAQPQGCWCCIPSSLSTTTLSVSPSVTMRSASTVDEAVDKSIFYNDLLKNTTFDKSRRCAPRSAV